VITINSHFLIKFTYKHLGNGFAKLAEQSVDRLRITDAVN